MLLNLFYCKVLLNSSKVSTFTLGNGMLWSARKWLSSLTMKSALAMMAQSTNLLSSGSASIRLKWNCGSQRITKGLRRMAPTIFVAKEALTFSVSISIYSLTISLLMQSVYFPSRNESHAGRYLLRRGIIRSRQLVSITTYLIPER